MGGGLNPPNPPSVYASGLMPYLRRCRCDAVVAIVRAKPDPKLAKSLGMASLIVSAAGVIITVIIIIVVLCIGPMVVFSAVSFSSDCNSDFPEISGFCHFRNSGIFE